MPLAHRWIRVRQSTSTRGQVPAIRPCLPLRLVLADCAVPSRDTRTRKSPNLATRIFCAARAFASFTRYDTAQCSMCSARLANAFPRSPPALPMLSSAHSAPLAINAWRAWRAPGGAPRWCASLDICSGNRGCYWPIVATCAPRVMSYRAALYGIYL